MSEQSERLFKAISDLKDETVDPALEPRNKRRHRRWIGWAAMAACFCLMVGILTGRIPLLGGRSNQPVSGADGAITFQSYAGPVLPMTLREENETITAQRAITLDFAPWVPVWDAERELERYEDSILVTDEYTLTNHRETEQTLTLLYPFVTNLSLDNQPLLEAEGEELETVSHWGSYAGFFKGSMDDTWWDGEHSSSLTGPTSWEDYQTLLSDGRYLSGSLGEPPDVSQVPVTVYKLTDPYGPARSQEAPNPTIRVSMELDYEQTHVLSYGFNGGAYDLENGSMVQSFFIPEEGDPEDGQTYYLLVLGEDVTNLTAAGYASGGTDPDTPVLEDCGVTVERYESSLDIVLRDLLTLYCGDRMDGAQPDPDILECYHQSVVDQMLLYGPLAPQSTQRYTYGPLEDLFSDAWGFQRVCWLETQVTVPAGGSLTVTASMEKQGSYDYNCDRANEGARGYDLMTTLGSNLACTQQTATLEDRGQIEILWQNFGFDLDAGIKTVALEAETEHYFLVVKRSSS